MDRLRELTPHARLGPCQRIIELAAIVDVDHPGGGDVGSGAPWAVDLQRINNELVAIVDVDRGDVGSGAPLPALHLEDSLVDVLRTCFGFFILDARPDWILLRCTPSHQIKTRCEKLRNKQQDRGRFDD